MNRPFSHQPRSARMFDRSEADVSQIISGAIEYVAVVVNERVVVVGHWIARYFHPTPVFGAMKDHVVAARRGRIDEEPIQSHLALPEADEGLDQFLIPPPDFLRIGIRTGMPGGMDSECPGGLIGGIATIQDHRQIGLLEIAQTLRLDRPVFGFCQGWQQHRRKNCDDGNDHQQFNKSESPRGFALDSNPSP